MSRIATLSPFFTPRESSRLAKRLAFVEDAPGYLAAIGSGSVLSMRS